MKQMLLTTLRDKNTKIQEFRLVTEKLAFSLLCSVVKHLEKDVVIVDTPLAKSTGYRLKNNVVIVPILRAALSLLPPFLKFFEQAKVGFIGLKRDEKTAVAGLYYKNLPGISKTDDVIILDPMIATGGSGSYAIKILKENGVLEEKIIFVAVISSKEGEDRISRDFPKVRIICVHQDLKLNNEKFIIPGLGDFGDRYFGTL